MNASSRVVLAATALLTATSAFAQTPQATAPRPAAPAALPNGGGPAIPGICTISQARTVASSTVGQHVSNRMRTIAQQVEGELRTDATAIETEQRTLQSQQATLARETLQQRALTLQQRAEAFERKRALRGRELQATQEKALNRISTDLAPLVQQIYTQRNCGLLIDRDTTIFASASMDITDAAIAALNGKLTTFTIERERLPETPAAGAAARPAAAAGAAPAAAPARPAATTPPRN